jgi:hypothetical protein
VVIRQQAPHTDVPSLDEFRRALSEHGWRELSTYPGYGFGSWLIEIECNLRVSYNGKDGVLELERHTSRDNWRKVWTAQERRDQIPAALIAALHDATR